jgi:TPR repeat protein
MFNDHLQRPVGRVRKGLAQVGMAICLLYGSVGRGNLIKTDCPAAIEWSREAAAQNDGHAEFHLAQRYEQGGGVSERRARH